MTDTMFTRTALTEAAETAGVTTDQARTILEAAGVDLTPAPSGPGMYRTKGGDVLIVSTAKTEYPDALWMCGEGGSGKVYMVNAEDLRSGSYPLTRIVPVAAAPVTLTEDQVGEVWDEHRVDVTRPWRSWGLAPRMSVTRTVNAILAQYAAPVEGELIDPDDVRAGDRVRVVLDNGDEATVTVKRVDKSWFESHYDAYARHFIRAVYLLHREEA